MTIERANTQNDNSEQLDGSQESAIQNSELSDDDAEAAMAAGFSSQQDSTLGEQPGLDLAKDEDTQSLGEESTENATERPSRDDLEKQIRELSKRVRQGESRYGSLKDVVDGVQTALTDNSGGQADPKQAEQIQVLLKNAEELEKAKAEFEELEPVIGEFHSMAEQIAVLNEELASVKSGIEQQVTDGIATGFVEQAHPDWEEVTKTEDFRRWMLNGGPPQDEYFKYINAGREPNAADQPADEYLADWQSDYPQWWQDRGEKLFSSVPRDAVYVLDKFYEASEQKQQQANTRQSKEQSRARRLRGNLTPEGVGADPATTLSGDEEMARGFAKAGGGR